MPLSFPTSEILISIRELSFETCPSGWFMYEAENKQTNKQTTCMISSKSEIHQICVIQIQLTN